MLPGHLEREFGKRVREKRLKKKFSQLELSKQIGVSRETIANIEGGFQRTLLQHALELREAIGVKI